MPKLKALSVLIFSYDFWRTTWYFFIIFFSESTRRMVTDPQDYPWAHPKYERNVSMSREQLTK